MAPDVKPYLLRKAAFGLRKARQLKPEFVVRIADWGRVITNFSANELAKGLDRLPALPGVYIFRDASGYLYIGESNNLRNRLRKHLNASGRGSLADYLRRTGARDQIIVEVHAFARDSQASKTSYRRAYESELIHSRNPRFNMRPLVVGLISIPLDRDLQDTFAPSNRLVYNDGFPSTSQRWPS